MKNENVKNNGKQINEIHHEIVHEVMPKSLHYNIPLFLKFTILHNIYQQILIYKSDKHNNRDQKIEITQRHMQARTS